MKAESAERDDPSHSIHERNILVDRVEKRPEEQRTQADAEIMAGLACARERRCCAKTLDAARASR